MLKVIETPLRGVLLFEPKVFEDPRGFFYESWNERSFAQATGLDVRFVQDNHSLSVKGVLRGIHYQIRHPQGKVIRVVRGEIFDVAVDLRKSSAAFGRWFGVLLSERNRRQLWVPPGFGHGFLSLSDVAEVIYKTTDYWAPEHERTLLWSDPAVGVEWPSCSVKPILSRKDSEGLALQECEVFD